MYLIVTDTTLEDKDKIGWFASVVHNNKVVGVAKHKNKATDFEIETEEMEFIIENSKSGAYQVAELEVKGNKKKGESN